ncbi:hypothetical protein BDD43_3505 [Mucilaginibacter gracilis]|uniref:Uncharacterized protein n=1 Tax=Mucilaginibacter gracilis TaxID=423350 RepID=A0A495J2V6_9SPHI|nr:hypothetical protein [Mucilaginibacter gracilis]RKR83300.1 hypothetical protein BDD43_3505 [Mucilaginibacter gracilis]
MEDTKKSLLSVDIDTSALIKNTADAKQKVADLTAQLKALKGTTNENSAEAVNLAAQLKNARAEVTQGINTAAQYDKAIKSNTGYQNGLKLELSLLQKQIGELSKEQLNNAEVGGKMQAKAQALSKEIMGLDKAMGSNKSTIGDYENNIVSALNKTGLFGDVLGKAAATAKSFKDGITTVKDGVESATTALTNFAASSGAFANANSASTIGLTKTGASAEAAGEGIEVMTVGTAAAGAGMLKLSKDAQETGTEVKTFTDTTGIASKGLDLMAAGTEKTSRGFNILKLGMKATGIGLLIFAFSALITYFEKTNEGSKKLKVIMAQLGSVTESIFKILGPIGKAIFDVFTEPQGAVKLMTSLFSISIIPIKTLFSVLYDLYKGNFKQAFLDIGNGAIEFAQGVKEAGVAGIQMFKDTVKASGEAADAISKVSFKKSFESTGDAIKARQALTKAEREWSTEKLQQQDTLGKINSSLKNVNITEANRIKMIEQAKAIRETIYKRDLEIAQENLRIITEQQKFKSMENKQAVTDAKNRVQELTNSYDAEIAAYDTKTSKLQKRGLTAKQAEDRLLKEAESDRVASLSRTQQKLYDSYAEEILKNDEKYRKLEEKYKNYTGKNLEIRAKYLQTIAQLEREKAAEQKVIQDKFNKEAQDNLEALNKRLADIRSKQSDDDTQKQLDELHQQTKDQLDEIDKQSIALVNKMAEQQQNMYDLKAAGDDKAAAALQHALDTELKELEVSGQLKEEILKDQKKKEDAIKSGVDDKKTNDKISGDISDAQTSNRPLKEFQNRQKQLDAEHDQAVKAAKGNKEAIYKIDMDYQKKTKDLGKEKLDFEINLAKGVIGLLGKNTEAYRIAFKAYQAYQAASTIIATEATIMKIWTATADVPFVGVPMAIAETAIAAAQGAIALDAIWSAKAFATGGVYRSDGTGGKLSGPGTGTSDSINARLSHGESIVNARSTAMFGPLLSALNVAGGGRPFDVPALNQHFAMGGYFNAGASLNIPTDMTPITDAINNNFENLPAKIGDHIAASMPKQVVVIEDIQAALANKAMLKNRSNF